MSYRGVPPVYDENKNHLHIQSGVGDGTATPIPLTYNPGIADAVVFTVNGIDQIPNTHFSVAGNNLVPLAAIPNGNNWCIKFLGVKHEIHDIPRTGSGILVDLASATPTTIMSVADDGLYNVCAYKITGVAADVSASAVVQSTQSSAKITPINGTTLTLTLSGTNVQVTQNTGAPLTVQYKFLKI